MTADEDFLIQAIDYMNLNQKDALIAIGQSTLGIKLDCVLLVRLNSKFFEIRYQSGGTETNLAIPWKSPELNLKTELRTTFFEMYVDSLEHPINQ